VGVGPNISFCSWAAQARYSSHFEVYGPTLSRAWLIDENKARITPPFLVTYLSSRTKPPFVYGDDWSRRTGKGYGEWKPASSTPLHTK